MDDGAEQSPDGIARRIADLEKLHDLTDDFSRTLSEVEGPMLVNPEFIRRSLAAIYDSQAVLARSMVEVLEALQGGDAGAELAEDERGPSASRKPFLRIVDPEEP